jgi:hypothetical protein
VTLLTEGQRATVLQLPVVHQISGRTVARVSVVSI